MFFLRSTRQNSFLRRRFSKGLTLVELIFSMTILLLVMGLVTHIITHTTQTQSRLRLENQMRQSVQSGLFRIASALNQTRMLMQADTLGYAYLNRVSFTGAPPIIGGVPTANGTTNQTQLPTIRPEGSLSPEKDCVNFPSNFFRANSVGNLLMFAKYAGKFSRFSFTADTEKRSLDVYEFKLYYITNADSDNQPSRTFLDLWKANPTMRRLRLIEWTSQPYVDYQQFLDYIADFSTDPNKRITIRNDLTTAGLTRVWDRNATNINSAFYNLGSGNSASVPVNPSHMIPRARVQDILLAGSNDFSVAYNFNNNPSSSTYFPIRHQVPFFYHHNPPDCNGAIPNEGSTPNASTQPYPYGFEVMITGPASGRNVLLRITTAGRSYNQLVSHADMLTAYARDL